MVSERESATNVRVHTCSAQTATEGMNEDSGALPPRASRSFWKNLQTDAQTDADLPSSPRNVEPRPVFGTGLRQVFGLSGTAGTCKRQHHLLQFASQVTLSKALHLAQEPSANELFRSRLPLRGSSGFTPDSLFSSNLAGWSAISPNKILCFD